MRSIESQRDGDSGVGKKRKVEIACWKEVKGIWRTTTNATGGLSSLSHTHSENGSPPWCPLCAHFCHAHHLVLWLLVYTPEPSTRIELLQGKDYILIIFNAHIWLFTKVCRRDNWEIKRNLIFNSKSIQQMLTTSCYGPSTWIVELCVLSDRKWARTRNFPFPQIVHSLYRVGTGSWPALQKIYTSQDVSHHWLRTGEHETSPEQSWIALLDCDDTYIPSGFLAMLCLMGSGERVSYHKYRLLPTPRQGHLSTGQL